MVGLTVCYLLTNRESKARWLFIGSKQHSGPTERYGYWHGPGDRKVCASPSNLSSCQKHYQLRWLSNYFKEVFLLYFSHDDVLILNSIFSLLIMYHSYDVLTYYAWDVVQTK